MTVLVTGATGGLGRSVVARLLAEGHAVAILTRRPFRAEALFGPEVAIHEWHPVAEAIPPAALVGATAAIHLMGEPLAGWPVLDRPDLVRTSRITTTRRLTQVIADAATPMRLVVASLALGLDGEGVAVSEAEVAAAGGSAPSPRVSDDVHAWEEIALGAQTSTLSIAVVRFALIAGAGAPLTTLVALARRGLVPDVRGLAIAAIDPADAAAMLTGLVQVPTMSGIIHGAAPVAIPGDALVAALRRTSPVPWAPLVPIRLLRRYLGHAAALLASRRPVAPARLLEAGADFASPDPWPCLERAIETLSDRRGIRSPLTMTLRRMRDPRPAQD